MTAAVGEMVALLGDLDEAKFIFSLCSSWQGGGRAILGMPIAKPAAAQRPFQKPSRVTVSAKPGRIFRGTRLVIVASRRDICFLADLRINGMKQSIDDVQPGDESIPVETFHRLAAVDDLMLHTAASDALLEIDFLHRSAFDDVTIRCGVLGTAF